MIRELQKLISKEKHTPPLIPKKEVLKLEKPKTVTVLPKLTK